MRTYVEMEHKTGRCYTEFVGKHCEGIYTNFHRHKIYFTRIFTVITFMLHGSYVPRSSLSQVTIRDAGPQKIQGVFHYLRYVIGFHYTEG